MNTKMLVYSFRCEYFPLIKLGAYTRFTFELRSFVVLPFQMPIELLIVNHINICMCVVISVKLCLYFHFIVSDATIFIFAVLFSYVRFVFNGFIFLSLIRKLFTVLNIHPDIICGQLKMILFGIFSACSACLFDIFVPKRNIRNMHNFAHR